MKIKFNLGWILAIAAAIVLAAMGFMSFYYLFEGNIIMPIIVAVCLLVIPIVVNMALVPAKECSKPFYFHRNAVKEATMLVAMVVLFIASMLIVNHFFTVNSRTEEIANIIADQRHQLVDMQASYSKHIELREKNYQAYLQEVLDNKERDLATYTEVFPSGSNDIELMVHEMHKNISLDGLNKSVPEVYDSENISWWELPSVMNRVDMISTALSKNYDIMVKRDHNFSKDNIALGDYWTYRYTSVDDIMSKFTKTTGFITSIWTIISVLIAFFFILLPYIVVERDSRSKGLFAELRKCEDDEVVYSSNNRNIGKL